MTFEVYKELLSLTLSHNYKIDSYYLGEQYDLVGISQKNEDFETKEICLVSLNRTESYVKNEIEKLPEISLSGMRNFLKNKKSTILRVFV